MWPGFDNNLDRANELAERGVALDGASAIALTRLGWIQTFLRRYDQAVANMEKAILLEPNNADVNATFGQVLNYWGNPERGLQMQEKAFSIDTFVPPNWEFQLGLSRLLLRQYDEALAGFNRAIERAPKFTPAHLHLAWAYVELNRLDDAKNAIKTVLELIPHYTLKEVARIFVYRVDEVRDRLFDCLRKAGMPE
jgi:tetratricopeptide (TPR) repeat protein